MKRNEHWRAFGPEWFADHQAALLWLLNAPILGHWFRWCLRIRSCDDGYRARIIEILPHAYTIEHDGKFVADFRTHWKFSKRLYHAFRPLWWAMHAWDWVADGWFPHWSFGLSTLTTSPDANPESTSVDGFVGRNGVNETWATIRSGAGTFFGDSNQNLIVGFVSSSTTDQWTEIDRSILLFDTSSVAWGEVSVLSSRLIVNVETKTDTLGSAPSVCVVSSNPASNTGLSNSDYGTLGGTACSEVLQYASMSAGTDAAFELNADGMALIASITKLGLVNYNYDLLNSAPTWASSLVSSVTFVAADLTPDPRLRIEYSLPNPIARPNRVRPALFSPGIAR